mmetsp:Transcript_9250/g.17681  ORF Transcript_9250/g.17681 Transcript_9250/m.17681 type:complete len:90 (+) Transcript_9250:78-347(+)
MLALFLGRRRLVPCSHTAMSRASHDKYLSTAHHTHAYTSKHKTHEHARTHTQQQQQQQQQGPRDVVALVLQMGNVASFRRCEPDQVQTV